MKENKIKFMYSSDEFKELFQDIHPIPAKLNVPNWYKELKTSSEYVTIKSCMPFLDSLTSGYILKMPQDFYIAHNYMNKDNKPDSSYKFSFQGIDVNETHAHGVNVNTRQKETHSTKQLGEKCPFNNKNKNLPFYKILNPVIIKTPPGYSCLFVSPLNNRDDRFEIVSGIVDTDTYSNHINFPIIINGDKYPNLETTIERGTPYVQIIPFKRDDWKMEIGSERVSMFLAKIKIMRKIWNNYKTFFWKRKRWN